VRAPHLYRSLRCFCLAAFSVLAAVALIDVWLLYRFFRHQRLEAGAAVRSGDRGCASSGNDRAFARSGSSAS